MVSELKKGDLVEVLDVEDSRDLIGVDKHGIRAENEVPALKFIGRVGRIVEVKTGGRGSVGNSSSDPLYVVKVPVLGEDGFWAEELKKIGV